MNRKSIFGKVLLIISLVITLCLPVDIVYGYLTKEDNWNEQMRTSLVSVLEESMEERGKEDVYIVSHSYNRRDFKGDSAKIVTIDVGEGSKEYIVPAYKHYNNIAENPTERLFDSVILEEQPLAADSLNMLWDSLLVKNGISGTGNIRVSVTDLSENISMTYAKDNDFLFVTPNVIHKSLEVSASFLGFAVLVPVSIIQLFFNPDSKNYPIIEQDVVNRHRKEIIELLMDIYRYSRSEKPVDLLGMNACVLQIFHILLSESMAAPTCTTPPDPN